MHTDDLATIILRSTILHALPRIMDIMHSFSRVLGLHLNLAKCKVFSEGRMSQAISTQSGLWVSPKNKL